MGVIIFMKLEIFLAVHYFIYLGLFMSSHKTRTIMALGPYELNSRKIYGVHQRLTN